MRVFLVCLVRKGFQIEIQEIEAEMTTSTRLYRNRKIAAEAQERSRRCKCGRSKAEAEPREVEGKA